MAFRVQLLDASGGTFDQYGTEGSFSVIEGGELRVHGSMARSPCTRPTGGSRSRRTPKCIKEEEHAEETTNDRPS